MGLHVSNVDVQPSDRGGDTAGDLESAVRRFQEDLSTARVAHPDQRRIIL